MTEAEWMKSTDLSAMLNALGGEVSDSKLRLFACACCRCIWDLIDTNLHRPAVEYAEWFARGLGRNLQWLGTGNWARRCLSFPLELIQQTEGREAINRELQAAQNELLTAALQMQPGGTDISVRACPARTEMSVPPLL